ncbi:MAG TPA: hypothetical protein VNF47_03470 [Streptosporangiaceae bacterium]|nr:hypothetical protein [Streptosporangiaceae bacterium]
MSLTLKRSLIGLVLLTGLAAGCSSSSNPAPKPAAHHTSTGHAPTGSQIPQNNGGDHDGDNNGGPSDGDGNL